MCSVLIVSERLPAAGRGVITPHGTVVREPAKTITGSPDLACWR
ncbi:hypothetical protein GJA_1100 [Janthinobacterium agaricidamnosum NBRC 102515 = DSM 9628]|uniref:Uncharacterized protein n=1 Tax=Janthinobacterium agaricidamnosum NBRC 102515 = DSM 9628 TaxID=1349767 RepID=W0V1K2_9BURK|nr:hypothetical protein GJA_1100 [Janthinobacterium agaricidamnosum NBRC 102515 = DSM 9628]